MSKKICQASVLLLLSGFAQASSLSFGPFGQGVYSGTSPFNVTGICSDAGDDCNDTDNRIRSADRIQYSWSIAASGIPLGDPDFAAVILEQTIYPGVGAELQIDGIPTICLAPPVGPGGSNPPSSLTTNPDNSITLMCNLNSMTNGQQKSFSVPVLPKATSANNSTFTTSQIVYALDAAGNKIVADTAYVDNTVYEVSAAPAFDLIATRQNMYKSYIASYDLGEGNGLEPGYVSYFTAHIAADQDRAGKGIEALDNAVTFKPVFTATGPSGPILDLPYRVVECSPNTSGWSLAVYGKETSNSNKPITKKVVDSGTCAYAGDYQTGYTMTINNLNSEGSRYPTETVNGTSLLAGPYFVASYRLRVWVPFSAIDAADGIPTNNVGAIQLSNCLSDFDPNSQTGVSNYAGDFEPGFNGAVMPDGSASNSCTGPLTLEITATAGYNHRMVSTATDWGAFTYPPHISAYHSGDAILEPGLHFGVLENITNSGSLPLSNTEACMMYDNTVAEMVDANNIGALAGNYAYLGGLNSGGFVRSDWQIEYGTAAYVGDDPLDGDADGVADFNPLTGRYEGEWAAMRAMRCDDPTIVNWNTDPTVIGIDNVNIIRVTAIDPTVTSFDPGQNIRLFLPLEVRDTFNGGANAGTSIPPGTVIASMSTFRSDEVSPTWRNMRYVPSPETAWGAEGDRVTTTRITIDIVKSTHTPFAAPGVTQGVLAGNDVVWQLDPVVTSLLPNGGMAEGLTIVDTLPSGLSYNSSCTQALADGTAPDLVEYGLPAAGQTRLTWFHGDVLSTASHTPKVFCTTTNSLSAAGTVLQNSASISATNATVPSVSSQGISLGQTGSIQTSAMVDSVIDSPNDDQIHTLSWYNFSTAGTIAAPTIINVLPFNGDGVGASVRGPASDFTGSLALAGAATVTFSDGSVPAAAEPVLGTVSYTADVASGVDHNPNVNSSNWCEFDGTNFVNPSNAGACPASFADVTAVRHVSNYDLEPDGNPRQGLVMTYTALATNNTAGDAYTNIFGLDSNSLPAGQSITAQSGVVQIASFSIGDYIFADIDNDGAYTAGVDLPTPDGTPVELRLSSDDTLIASTTTTNGTYLFDGLSDGDFYVQVPASIFDSSQPFGTWNAAVLSQPANVDANQEVDHSGTVLTNVTIDGVRTDTVTLSAAQSSVIGGAPSGEEPVGDNTFGINDVNTDDAFSNLTIDIGLISGDADADGIPDVVEFGGTALNALLDSDNDGTKDYLDTDSDNDGIADSIEAGATPTTPVDSDGDGVVDYLDLDSDDDGILDSVEGIVDLDGDNLPDYIDFSNPPVASGDATTVAADTIATIVLSSKITDADNDQILATIDLDPTTSGIQSTVTTTEGVWAVGATGDLSFDPVSSFAGTASIPYTVQDAAGLESNSANVSVTVATAPPLATADSASVLADISAVVDLSDNVTDANNDADITTIDLDPSATGIQNTLTTVDGDWSVDATGLLTFDPVVSFEGTASIPYTVADVAGNVSAPALVSVIVAGATPMATNDSASVAADTIASIDLSDNVTDANNDIDLATIDLDPTVAGIQSTLTTIHGTWVVDAAGLVTFDPVSTFEGNSTISYTVSDDDGNTSAVANVTANISGAIPMATNDAATATADTMAAIDLSDNVTDANNDIDITTIDLDPTVAGIQSTLTTAHGDWTVDSAGVVAFDPVSTFEGTSTISYTVSDDDGNVSGIANITVTIGGATPIATSDSAAVLADINAAVDLSDNVTDANNDIDITTIDLDPATLGVQSTITTADGDWSVDPVGMVIFDPVSSFEGATSIAYTVADDDGNVSVAANVTVTVAGAAPIVTADSASVLSDTDATVDLADNVTDANNDLDITTVDLDPATVGIQNTLSTADGDWLVDPAGLVSFDPAASFEGVAVIGYTVEDSNGNIATPANVSVTVGGATPMAINDAATTAADTIASIELTDNVTDANNDIDITTIDLDPTVAGVQNTLTTIHGDWAVDAAGIVTFDPVSTFEGNSTISYTVSDDDGNTSAVANVTVNVAGATPIATADSASVLADNNASVDLSDNITDANNDTDITTIDLDPATQGVQSTLTTAAGVWSVDPVGIVTFDPVSSFEGAASIAYTVSDDDGNISAAANVTVTVAGAAPIATADSASVLADMNATFDLGDNVTDANNDLDITTIDLDPETAGIQNTLTTTDGFWSVDAAGLLSFNPAAAFEGVATIAYTVEDSNGNIATPANVSVAVSGAIPMATNDAATVAADTIASVDLSDNVTDANSDTDITTIDLDPTVAGIQNTLTTIHGEWSVDAAGVVSFDPVSTFEGNSTISYTVSDDDGNTSVAANVTVNVSGAIPNATADSVTVLADTNAAVDLSDNVTDANNDIDIATIDLDLATPGVQSAFTTVAGVWSVDPLGTVTFDPVSSFEGAASIAYTVSDDDGNVSAAANVTVFVAGAAPIATADFATVLADTNAAVDLADNITDANNDLDITSIDLDPATVGIQNTLTTADGDWAVDPAGLVSFDPISAFEGIATIAYTVEDSNGNIATPSTVSVTVDGAIPMATNDAATATADTMAAIDLSDNVTDANSDIDITTIDLDPTVAGIQNTLTTIHGDWTVDAAGLVTFDPVSTFEGNSTISYTVSDDDGNTSAVANVTVNIGGATPMATNDAAITAADTIASVDLTDNVTDANNDIDITTIDLDPTVAGIQNTLTTIHGAWSVDAAGLVTFDPVSTFEGNSTISYAVSDDDGNTSVVANITVSVSGAIPIVTADSAAVLANTNAVVDLSDNVTDANNDIDITTIDLDPATPGVQSTLTTAAGVWSVDPEGMVTFDPVSSFEGAASIAYTVSDDDGNVSAAANVTVTVAGAAPIATADSVTVLADINATVDLADNVTDANNDLDITTIDLDPATAGIQNALATADGDWSVDLAGLVSFNPEASFEGVATIAYTVEDSNGNIATPANVSVNVSGAIPMATNDAATVAADTLASIDLSDNVSDANSDIDITTIDLDSTVAGIQSTLTTIHGDWSVDTAGVVTFDPVSSFEGNSTIAYTVSDDDGNVSAGANVTVTVAGAAPIAIAYSTTVPADTIISTIDLAGNVTDANYDADITTIDLDPATAGVQNTLTTADGDWAVDPAGIVSFDPAAAFEGVATIGYTVGDINGNIATPSAVFVTVGGAIPIATNDAATVLADSIASVVLTDNITDANNDIEISTIDLDPTTAGIQSTLTTVHGAWAVDADGLVTFDPVSTFEGTSTIAYTVADDDGNIAAPANISVTIGGATPMVTNDAATATADTIASIDLSDNVADANNDVDITTIDLDLAVAGIQNTLTTVHGAWAVDAAGMVTFDPVASFEGNSTISYTVSDDDGNVSAGANVTVNIGGATPVATPDAVIVLADTNAVVDLTDNVSDANNDIDISTIDLDTANSGVQSTLATADGIWSVNTAGIVTFDPVSSFEGTTAIPYTVEDDDGNVSAPANVTVTVAGAAPIATADAATVLTDTNAIIDLADNITDANSNADITTIDLDSTTTGVQSTLTTADGVWSVDSAGIVSFDPVPAFEGTATIPYTVSDIDSNVSAASDVSVTVGGATPIATNDVATVTADTIAGIDLSDNVSDLNSDVELTTIDLDPTAAGIQNTLTTIHGVWAVDSAGMVTFDPTAAFEGTSTIAYSISDDDGNTSAPANVSVTVGGATPMATSDSASVLADTNAAVDLSDNVADANNDIDITTIDLDPGTPGVQNSLTTIDGAWSVEATGVTIFDPIASFAGSTSIPYTVADDDGNVSLPASITVTVGSASPIADSESETTIQNMAIVIDVLAGDNDANNDIDSTSIDLDPATPSVQSSFSMVGEGLYEVVAAQVVFTPEVVFFGSSGLDYTVSDAAGNVSNIANINITVLADTDSDGVANIDDIDDDNDGIPDLQEGNLSGNNDTDGDGIIDSLDSDSDNDGISDATEAGGSDEDGDGIIDGFTDTDNDGLDDSTGILPLPANDTDADGLPNFQDLDSDNDGLTDIFEAGGTDTDNDGLVDGFTDINGDGLDDAITASLLPLTDSDTDGAADFLDTDSDNDGIPDVTEAGGIDTDGDSMVDGFTDANNDGLDDAIAATPLPVNDFDADGTPDYLDSDSDADGIPDNVEAGSDPTAPVDTDADSVADYLDDDSDADAIPDAIEAGANGASPVDTDADNIPDYLDQDSDDDGISDNLEAGVDGFNPADSNGDGIADYQEVDSDADGDGILDSLEGLVDTDLDGVPDYLDTDSDNDGIPDSIEESIDSDADGITDNLDLDSDADGIPDSIEAGSDPSVPLDSDTDGVADYLDDDSDADGIPDNLEAGPNGGTPVDTDADGIADYIDLDSDSDSIPDNAEAGSDPLIPIDSDADGIPDYQEGDSDSDNDGIPDSVEGLLDTDADGIADYLDPDSDNDGIPDSVEQSIDSDADGVADNLDLDSDADGIPDSVEAGADPLAPVDTDTDGTADYLDDDSDADAIPDVIEAGENSATPIDTDLDGSPDYLDTDSDNDSITDNLEAGIDGFNPADSNADGIADYRAADSDADNDGIPDAVEGLSDTDADGIPDYQDIDSDNDTIPDSVEGFIDTDNDAIADNLDLDSDADGIPDNIEAGADALNPVDTDNDGSADYIDIDSDADGLIDSIEAGLNATTPVDTDADGMPDYLDLDADNDTIPDNAEAGSDLLNPIDSDADGIPDYQEGGSDSDNDGIPDSVEGLADTDADGQPDYLDLDSDNDGIPDAVERSIDTDADGTADNLDLDSDADGIPDSIEAGANPLEPIDTDADGIADYLDDDSDADAIPDYIEAGENGATPVDTDTDGQPDYLDIDSDNDSIPDNAEVGSDGLNPIDSDADGIPDYLEAGSDSDGDGIPDSVEGLSDSDTDGIADYLDEDSDNDGIPDSMEQSIDSDGDGLANNLDSDSDADGIPDTIEAGSDPLEPVDTDADAIPDYLDIDSDGDAIQDNIEAGPNGGSPLDTDGDDIPDYLDLDSDADSIADNLEAGADPLSPTDSDSDGIPDYREGGSDSDGDAIPDSVEGTIDTDADGIANYLDEDSDNDGIPDSIELAIDTDGDTVDDYLDVDTDNDGISDAQETAVDTDADGVADFRDLDVDNDGIYDLIEARIGVIDVYQLDADNDGVVDFSNPTGSNGMADTVETAPDSGVENYTLSDIDRDLVFDFRDLDSDNDGLLDANESDHTDQNLDGTLDTALVLRRVIQAVDNTGLAPDAGGIPRNTDGDALADFRDGDSDNDGITDVVESFGVGIDLNNDAMLDDFTDSNGDGVDDNWLAVPSLAEDTDGDTLIDAIEIDSDGDTIADIIEAGGVDADGNGMIDGFVDSNIDGIDDSVADLISQLIDTDGDGKPDFQDVDSAEETDASDLGIGAATPVPDSGLIRTGVNGAGCAIANPVSGKASVRRIDPSLPAMGIFALLMVLLRRIRAVASKNS